MSYKTENIIESLKNARKSRQVNQRELGAISGIAQSHISKIENGAVDITLSTLVDLARSLDQEVMIVPRQLVPAVQAIVKGNLSSQQGAATSRTATRELANMYKALISLKTKKPINEEWSRIFENATSTINDLHRFSEHLPSEYLKSIRQSNNSLQAIQGDSEKDAKKLQKVISNLKALRNELAHSHIRDTGKPRSAYSLEDDADE